MMSMDNELEQGHGGRVPGLRAVEHGFCSAQIDKNVNVALRDAYRVAQIKAEE